MPHWTYLAKAWPVSEELAAAALCHGVERLEDLTEELIARIVQRLGGVQVYVPLRRVLPREQLKAEVCERFNGCNARELAWRCGISLRQVQRLLASTKD